ncbi:hypothetical protein ACIA8K_23515 [Catenuloplanes sp. NPDC051500]|uniref:hypothetical protein n=1 Tax=Catenuloplanes sp. NPDC051500 TaxID=3363959 RepID=UPI0037A46834
MELTLLFDPRLGVDTAAMARAWARAPELAGALAGTPSAVTLRSQSYLPDVVEVVLIPLAVNLASSALFEITVRLLCRQRPQTNPSRVRVGASELDGGRQMITVEEDEPTS